MEPFFSIIIPSYFHDGNSELFLPRMLDSIQTNNCLDLIEIILSDDKSTDEFWEICSRYPHLNIRLIENDHHHGFPRAGRQHGADEARGVWICFADQDDYFVDHAFDRLYQFITYNKAKNYIISDFIEEVVATGQRIIRPRGKGWTHGKFYEKAMWDRLGVRYDEISYCEDINLSVKLECMQMEDNFEVFELAEPLYVWMRRKDSLADEQYFADSMPDYAKATLGVIIQYMRKYREQKEMFDAYVIKFIVAFLHFYFYFQSDILCHRTAVRLNTVLMLQPYFTELKSMLGITSIQFLNMLSGDLLKLYNDTREGDFNQIPFIEQMTLYDWIFDYFE